MASSLRIAFLIVLMALSTFPAAAQKGGKGGKGCKSPVSPCADGSHPACSDGSKPDGSSQPPACPSGGEPLCKDGSSPQPQGRRDGNDSSRRRDDDGCEV